MDDILRQLRAHAESLARNIHSGIGSKPSDYMVGIAADEIERLRKIEKAAANVCWFDWSENDDDAVAAVAELRALLGPMRVEAPQGRADEQKSDEPSEVTIRRDRSEWERS